MQATSTKIAVTRYEKRPTRRVALSSVRSGRRGVGRGLGYEVEVRGRGRVGGREQGRVGSGTSSGNSVTFPGKHPPSDPDRDLGGQPLRRP